MHAAKGANAHEGLGGNLRNNLSARELQVLEMTSSGCTNSEIARRLDVTVHAVKFHLGSVYKKLGVANRTEAAVVFLQSSADQIAREE